MIDEKNREIWIGENRIHLGENNIIYFTAIGEHNDKMAIEISDAIMKLGETVEEKINILIDLNKTGKPSPGARKIFKDGIELEKAGKIAFIGIHPVARMLASFGGKCPGGKISASSKPRKRLSHGSMKEV